MRAGMNMIALMSDTSALMNRLRTALGLFDSGVSLMRQNLRRRHPDANDQEIDRLLRAWLTHRPGAEHGDGDGTRVTLRSHE
jgi:hypothetical protein